MTKRLTTLGIAALLLLTACLAVACGTSTQAPQPPSGATTAPTLSGAELLESRCGSCHALTRVTQARYTKADWESTVARMVRSGANLTSAESQVLVDYLAQKYGK